MPDASRIGAPALAALAGASSNVKEMIAPAGFARHVATGRCLARR
jgi:hypothetical protein